MYVICAFHVPSYVGRSEQVAHFDFFLGGALTGSVEFGDAGTI